MELTVRKTSRRSRSARSLRTIAALAVSAWSGLSIAGQGIEPLNPDEVARAEAIVMNAIAAQQVVDGSARSELLRTEVLDPGKAERGANRLARVFVYDYSANQLVVGRVDLVSGAVRSLKSMKRKQPPLSSAETERARDIALADPDTLAQISEEYVRITGNALDLSDVTIHVRGFNPRLARNRTNRRSANCLARRCARLTLVTDGSTLFKFVPIVDLSSEEVIQNIAFGPGNAHARQTRQRAAQNRRRLERSGARNDHGTHQH